MSVFRFGRSLVRSFCKLFTDKGKTLRLLFWHGLSLALNLVLVSFCKVVYDLLLSKDQGRLQQSQAWEVVVKSKKAT